MAANPKLGFDDARHLLNRAGFGATLAEVESYAALSRDLAIERLLSAARSMAITPAPAWTTGATRIPRPKKLSDEEKKALVRDMFVQGLELRGWWLREMLETPSTLSERMTLFWHNHFVSSQQKVKLAALMYRQNVLLRKHALGNFGELLRAVARDPAMVIYLDSASNRKGQPNENFARELMELFTLGEGHYSEHDIKEAARAFTGWSVDLDTGEFRFRRFVHDGGSKTVLGRSGKLEGDDVLDMLLERPETAQFVTTKLWREFISPAPDAAEVKRIAQHWRTSGYDTKAALRMLFNTPAFWHADHRAALIKSPIDLVVGTLHTFDVDTGELFPFALLSRHLGQDLFGPPNVKGWPGGTAWINSTTLLARKQFLDRLFRAQDMPADRAAMGIAPRKEGGVGGLGKLKGEGRKRLMQALSAIHFDSDAWLTQFSGADARLQQLLLAMQPVHAVETQAGGLELIRRCTQDPVYQLK